MSKGTKQIRLGKVDKAFNSLDVLLTAYREQLENAKVEYDRQQNDALYASVRYWEGMVAGMEKAKNWLVDQIYDVMDV